MSSPESGGYRARQCMFVLYPESQQAAIDYCQTNLPCAWALHDKDVHTQAEYENYIKRHDGEVPNWQPGDLKKPHMHFVCRFVNARWFSGIARDITKGSGVDIPTNTINRCNNLYKAYLYLWHELDPDKFQYDPSIVGMHDFEPPSEGCGMSQVEDEQVKLLLDMPHFENFGDMGRWAYENGCWASFRKNYGLWRDIFLERQIHSRKPPAPAPTKSPDPQNLKFTF